VAQLIALLLLIAIYLEFGPALTRKLSRAKRNVVVAGAVAILLSMFAVGWASHLDQPFSRWQTLNQSVSNDFRWLAWRVAIGALPDAGFLGFGPGTFRVVFPFYNSVTSSHAPGVWRFLHEDYLQTVLEWGWLGSGTWGLLFFGGMVIAICSYKNRSAETWSPRRRLLQPFVIVALTGVALHALVDFPLQIASIQLYVVTYLGLCWGSGTWDRRENTRKSFRRIGGIASLSPPELRRLGKSQSRL
jgi:O-antigen ligase